ncbi:RNA-directed DNA polymerase from mobile element jockey [Trichonephila clavipes]|nr:RNA-directed DNA polymerase from mobile element jockey [Trichonephila clavipes]
MQLFSENNGIIDPQAELTLFDDNIQWVPVVRYLGLHIDSGLTYKNHTDYLSDKFWGRIALAISLIGRSSPLSLENKVILYKQILRPTITTGISVKAGSSFATPAVSSGPSGAPYGTKHLYSTEMSKPYTYGSFCEVMTAGEIFPYKFQVYQDGSLIAVFEDALQGIRRRQGHYKEALQGDF